jgi:phosphohistidine phosphatase
MTSVPLRLDLVRHGEAAPAGKGGDDDARPLSDRGRAAIEALAERFARERWRPDAVWTSPLLRAQQTAAILVGRACPGVSVETLEALVPDHDPEDVTHELRARGAHGHVVLVGHQPLMGALVAWLTARADGAFPAGGVVRIDVTGALRSGTGTIALEIRPATPRA